MNNNSTELKINEEFKRMVQPITDDELLRLEKEISQNKNAKVFVINDVIVDGYEEYEIATELNLPISRIMIPVSNSYEAIVWICHTQLKRSDLTLMMRKYLIGKRSLAEQACEKGGPYFVSEDPHKRMSKIITTVRTQLAKEYSYCLTAVRDYETCAKTIDMLFSFDRETAEMLLRGKTHISQSKLIAFSKLSAPQLKSKMEELSNDKSRVDKTSTVKSTPIYDPDAEISSLSLTIPSWVNFIERVRKAITPQITEKAADEIFNKLNGLEIAAENLIAHITEVL